MGKIAFVFAGQGAQYPGMGKGLYASSPAAKGVFDACEKIRPGTLRQCFEGICSALGLSAAALSAGAAAGGAAAGMATTAATATTTATAAHTAAHHWTSR